MGHDEVVSQPRHEPLRRPPIAFAHRGGAAHARENTLEAFANALRLGATGLESDVWITADGVPILDHDGRTGRWFWRKPVRSVDRSVLAPHVPSLAQLYQHVGSDYELSLDLKDPDAFDAVVSVAREQAVEPRLWVVYSDWEAAARWRDRTTARLVHSTRMRSMKQGPERLAASLGAAGIDAVNLPADEWTGGLTALFHRFDRYCLGWGAQHERQISALVRMGIDGIFGDHVDRLVEVIGREP